MASLMRRIREAEEQRHHYKAQRDKLLEGIRELLAKRRELATGSYLPDTGSTRELLNRLATLADSIEQGEQS